MNLEPVEHMMEIVLQMKINLMHVADTLHQQTDEIRREMQALFEIRKKALDHCLSGIDDKLRECAAYVEDYKQVYASLATMREKLVQLGSEPSPLPAPLPAATVGEVVVWRLQELTAQGKIAAAQ